LPHSTFTPAHNFTVTLESSTYTPEKYALYTHYQTTVHRDTPSSLTPSSFRRFLCDSSLPLSTTPTGQRLGTHHQLYRLDGRLIALAVLDLLPHAVSAVYFLYHADHEAASFGKLSALREAALALEGGYEWYYMGYYIHNCAKMRYKADFAPQFVLDPQGYTWDQLDGEFLKALDENALVSMSARRRSRSENTTEREDEVEPGPAASDDGTASVFAAHMPGTLPLSRILETTDLAHKLVCLGGGGKNKPRQMVFLNVSLLSAPLVVSLVPGEARSGKKLIDEPSNWSDGTTMTMTTKTMATKQSWIHSRSRVSSQSWWLAQGRTLRGRLSLIFRVEYSISLISGTHCNAW